MIYIFICIGLRMRLMGSIRHDMNKCGLEERDAQDRRRWRMVVRNHYLEPQLDTGEKDTEEEEECLFDQMFVPETYN